MILRIVDFALHQRFVVLAFVLLLTVGGIIAFYRLPIEAYPDVADVEVDVITLWPGHAPEEVERHITIPLENELNGIARVTFLRSISNFGLSNIRVLFLDGTDDYWARQHVQERIARAELPTDVEPGLGPLASFVIAEVYRYTLESKTMPLVELKALQDWFLERELRKVPGVVDVVSWGGGIKQYQIMIDPERLRAYNVTLKQVSDAVSGSNANAGGSYIQHGFRPIIVTAIVAIIGFLPAALSHGIGAEIQRPLARVVIGGLISATAMTLLVLPAIYELLARRQERHQPVRAETS